MGKIYALLLLVMMFWGFNVSALKVLVTTIDPIFLTSVRIFTAGISVLIISYFMKIFRLPTKKELVTIAYITIFNVVFHHSLLAIGLTRTSGVNAGLILGTAPLVTMVLSILLLNDRVTRMRVLGFILGFIGIVVTSLSGTGGLSTVSIGDLWIFLSMLLQAFSFILISKLNPDFDPRLLTGYMLVLGSVFIFVFSLIVESNVNQITALFSWKLGLIFLFSAVLCTAFGHMTYNFAVKNVGPAETTIFINLNTFFSLAGAAIFLGEPILLNHFYGLILILCGVFIGSGTLEYMWDKRKKARMHMMKNLKDK
ncbi:DMT family transporter [Virgibacillus sp. W0430]|uniref:DMT family transporter n=1 Tax=Virgibacillus sp. W0430 TaxID=3391580 RepID=UPI003F46EBC7